MSKRSSYTLEFKMQVLRKLKELDNNITQTARFFSINRKQIQQWRKNEEAIRSTGSMSSSHLSKRRIPSSTRSEEAVRHRARYPDIEQELVTWIRQTERSLQLCEVQSKARELQPQGFAASKGWLYRFLRRNNITYNQLSTLNEQSIEQSYTPPSLIVQEFLTEIENIVAENEIPLEQIVSVDEVACCFDAKPHGIVKAHEKLRFTVILACTSNGEKLTPLVVFKNLKEVPALTPGKEWPVSVVSITGSDMTIEVFAQWIEQVYKNQQDTRITVPNVFIMDRAKCHQVDTVKQRSQSSQVVFIPQGYTELLQPLELVVHKPFRQYLAESYKRWRFQALHKREAARLCHFNIATWIAEAWQQVSNQTIVNSFELAGITGSVGDMHLRLRNIIEGVPNKDINVADTDEGLFEEQEIIRSGIKRCNDDDLTSNNGATCLPDKVRKVKNEIIEPETVVTLSEESFFGAEETSFGIAVAVSQKNGNV